MDKNNLLGLSIKKYRQNKKISRIELGEKIGCSVHAIEKYEQGQRTPNLDVLLKISEALEVSLDDLIQGEIKANERHWEAIKVFKIDFVLELIEKLKNITITKSDKQILLAQEDLLNNTIQYYENLKNTDVDKTHLEFARKSILSIESVLKTIKDKYI